MRKKNPGGRPITVDACHSVNVRVDQATIDRLADLAKQWQCSKAAAVRRCVATAKA